MGNGMNKVIPGLYVGNFRDSREEEQLKANKITHILSVHDNAKPHRPDMIYLCVSAKDVGTENLANRFSECNDFIHNARIYGGNVLVHCLAGMSRSVTVAVAYIMTTTELGWRDALSVVRTSRPVASPNFGFQKQLLTFQHEGVSQERQRLVSAHKPQEITLDDVSYCQRVLDEFESQNILEKYDSAKTDKAAHRLSSSSQSAASAQHTGRDTHNLDDMFLNPRTIRTEYYESLTLPRKEEEKTCQSFASITLKTDASNSSAEADYTMEHLDS